MKSGNQTAKKTECCWPNICECVLACLHVFNTNHAVFIRPEAPACDCDAACCKSVKSEHLKRGLGSNYYSINSINIVTIQINKAFRCWLQCLHCSGTLSDCYFISSHAPVACLPWVTAEKINAVMNAATFRQFAIWQEVLYSLCLQVWPGLTNAGNVTCSAMSQRVPISAAMLKCSPVLRLQKEGWLTLPF